MREVFMFLIIGVFIYCLPWILSLFIFISSNAFIRFQFFNLCLGHCLPNSTFLFCYLLALILSFYLLDSTYQDPIFPHLHLIQCFSWLSASWILSFQASFSFVVFPQFWNFMYSILHRIHTVECLVNSTFLDPILHIIHFIHCFPWSSIFSDPVFLGLHEGPWML